MCLEYLKIWYHFFQGFKPFRASLLEALRNNTIQSNSSIIILGHGLIFRFMSSTNFGIMSIWDTRSRAAAESLDAPQPPSNTSPRLHVLPPAEKPCLDSRGIASSTTKGRKLKKQLPHGRRPHKKRLFNDDDDDDSASQVATTQKALSIEDPQAYSIRKKQHPVRRRKIDVLECDEQGSDKLKSATEENGYGASDVTATYGMIEGKAAKTSVIGISEPNSSRLQSRNAVGGAGNQADTDYYHKEQLRRDAINAAKKLFEKKKERVLSRISNDIKNLFGQIGFVKWYRSMRPVLVLNPYHAPPAPVRKDYFKERNSQLDIVVYWYGESDEKRMYSFVSMHSFVPYHNAMANGVYLVSAKIQQKIDSSARLSTAEEDMVRARSEVEQDLAKEPSERRRGVVDFVEGYETLTLEEVEQVLAEECLRFNDNDHTVAEHEEDGADDNNEDVLENAVKMEKEGNEDGDNGFMENAYHEEDGSDCDEDPQEDGIKIKKERNEDDDADNVSLHATIADHGSIQQKLEDDNVSLRAVVNDYSAKLSAQKEASEQQQESLSKELSELNNTLAQYKNMMLERDVVEQKLKTELEVLRNTVADHKRNEQDLKSENDLLRKTVTEHELKEKRLKARFESYRTSVAALFGP